MNEAGEEPDKKDDAGVADKKPEGNGEEQPKSLTYKTAGVTVTISVKSDQGEGKDDKATGD
jgi:hypothetical protein